MNRNTQMGRMILEAITGIHGDIARDIAQAWVTLAEQKQDMQSRIEALEKDAARYRWLLDEKTDSRYYPLSGRSVAVIEFETESSDISEAIDTAMKSAQKVNRREIERKITEEDNKRLMYVDQNDDRFSL